MICEMRNTYAPFVPPRIFPSVERERVQALGGLVGCGAGAAVLPLLLWLLFFFSYLVSLHVVPCYSFFFFFRSIFDNIPLCLVFSL